MISNTCFNSRLALEIFLAGLIKVFLVWEGQLARNSGKSLGATGSLFPTTSKNRKTSVQRNENFQSLKEAWEQI